MVMRLYSFVLVCVFLQALACLAQNPIIHNQFCADPSALVVGDRVYVYPSHDILPPEDQARKNWFSMEDYHVFSSSEYLDTTNCFKGWKTVFTGKGAAVRYDRVKFHSSPTTVRLMVHAPNGAKIGLKLGSLRLCTIDVPANQDWQVVEHNISKKTSKKISGLKDITVELLSDSTTEIDWLSFDQSPYNSYKKQ